MGEPGLMPKVYRPLGARLVAAVCAGVLTAVVAFLWLMLPGHVQDQFDWFQRGTLLLFFLLVLVALYGVFRTRVDVSDHGVSVTNGYRHHDFSWAEVVSISLSRHRPWALVDLADGSTRSVMALQTSDGPRASRWAREIAAMISAHSETERDD